MNAIYTSNPKVSVVIPCYNQAQYLGDAVASVLAQSFHDYEVVIVNDGSTDNTSEIANSLIINNPQAEIYLIEQENLGLSSARNTGIKYARGKYILPLDADDRIHPEMLKKTVSMLESDKEISIAYTDVIHFGLENLEVRASDYDFKSLIYNNQLNYCSLYRKEAWEAVGGYNPNMRGGYEDWDFWISCGGKGFYAKRIPEFLFMYRVKESSMYTKALSMDKELRAMIMLNHTSLYSIQEVEKAKMIVNNMTLNHKNNTLVSVIIPTYNRSTMLREALVSVFSQNYENFEIVVINDAGEDVKAIIDSLSDGNKIVYIRHNENKGLPAARNTGLRAAKGKYIAYLDDDDIFYPDHLQTLVYFLETNPVYMAAYTDANYIFQEWITDRYVTIDKKVIYSHDFDRRKLLISNFIPVLNMMHRRDLIDKAGFFDEGLKAHEDWEMWIRLSQYTDFYHIKKTTAEVRFRADGSTMTSRDRTPFLNTLMTIHKRYSHLDIDANVVREQKKVEWALMKEIALSPNGAELKNSDIVELAEVILKEKDKVIEEKDKVIEEKDKVIEEKDKVIEEILNTRGWKLLEKYRGVRNWLSR